MSLDTLTTCSPPTTLTEIQPENILQHGPSKRYVDEFLWFEGKLGAVATYQPTAEDVKDHFGVFRGVDQVESFAQGTAVAAITLLEAQKQGMSIVEFQKHWNIAFLGVEQVKLLNFLREGDRMVAVAQTTFHRFHQMIVNGKTFRAPADFDLQAWARDFSKQDLLDYRMPESFQPIGEISDLKVVALKKTKF